MQSAFHNTPSSKAVTFNYSWIHILNINQWTEYTRRKKHNKYNKYNIQFQSTKKLISAHGCEVLECSLRSSFLLSSLQLVLQSLPISSSLIHPTTGKSGEASTNKMKQYTPQVGYERVVNIVAHQLRGWQNVAIPGWGFHQMYVNLLLAVPHSCKICIETEVEIMNCT